MFRVIVRSGKDADAVRAMLERFYPGWNVEVATLRGARSREEVLRELEAAVDRRRLNVVLLDRESESLVEAVREVLPPNAAVRVVPRSKVRNARLEMLAEEFDRARAMFRLCVEWLGGEETYRLDPATCRANLEEYAVEPQYDLFAVYGGGLRILGEVLGAGVPGDYVLMLRMLGGVHRVYSGSSWIATVRIPDRGLDVSAELRRGSIPALDFRAQVKANEEVLRVFEEVSLEMIRRYAENADVVVVPWSGGKDSTLVLYLASKVVPRSRLRAVFADTGLEFPQTLEFAEKASKALGVRVEKVYAGIDRALDGGAPLPRPDNRWCTALKISAVSSYIESLVKEGLRVVVLVGDRDSESESRSLRPPARWEGGALYVAPIKFWGTLHVQLYSLWRGLPSNPLYDFGFYRIGCYICPALRSWELRIVASNRGLLSELLSRKFFAEFLRSKGVDPEKMSNLQA